MATLGDQAVGSIVKLNVNKTAKKFIVVHQGKPSYAYDCSSDSTWLLMEDIYLSRTFDETNHDYANSDIHSYLNGSFLNLFDSDIKKVVKQVKIPYRAGVGSSTSVSEATNGLSTKVFLLSFTEVGFSRVSGAPTEGIALGYFKSAADSKRIAKLNGTAASWWLRTPYTSFASNTWYVQSNGSHGNLHISNNAGVRPALVLPATMGVKSDGTVVLESGAIKGSVNIGGVQRELTGKGYINIGGVLRDLSDSSVNIGGTMKSTKG